MSGNAGHIDAASGLRYSRICSYLSLVCGRSGLGLGEDIGRWRVWPDSLETLVMPGGTMEKKTCKCGGGLG